MPGHSRLAFVLVLFAVLTGCATNSGTSMRGVRQPRTLMAMGTFPHRMGRRLGNLCRASMFPDALHPRGCLGSFFLAMPRTG
jgi:hypothetical protein